MFRKALITRDRYKTDRITDDPTDNKFLACALEGRADYVLSRDPHLRNLKHYQGIQILDATAFLKKIRILKIKTMYNQFVISFSLVCPPTALKKIIHQEINSCPNRQNNYEEQSHKI